MDRATRTTMELVARNFPPVATMTGAEARAAVKAMPRAPAPPIPVGAVEDRLIERLGDGQLPVRVYRPEGDGEDTPVIVLFHGGGFVVGDVDMYDRSARTLCVTSRTTVMSVEYRLAPEHPFPAAVEDAITAIAWAVRELGGPVGVAGDSSGGNLAAVAALLARDQGVDVALQLLVYPLLDPTCSGRSHRLSGEGYFLTEAEVRWYWAQYLGGASEAGDAGDAVDVADLVRDPRAAPIHADLAEVAPATIVVAEHDPLLDDGVAYATALADAGVPVDLRQADGLFHGFFGLAHLLPEAAGALRDEVYGAVGDALRAATAGGRAG